MAEQETPFFTDATTMPLADVCMLVEGTYPYVSGGVSSWIHSLITNLPDFTFSLVHIGALPGAKRTLQYKLPANVIGVHDIFLHDMSGAAERPARKQSPA